MTTLDTDRRDKMTDNADEALTGPRLEDAYQAYRNHSWNVIKTYVDPSTEASCLTLDIKQLVHHREPNAISLKCDSSLFAIETPVNIASKLLALTRNTKAAGPALVSPNDRYIFLASGHLPQNKALDGIRVHDSLCAVLLPPTALQQGEFAWKLSPKRCNWIVPRATLLLYALIELT